ncbi:MAG: hypothetical protein IIX48_08385 [Lachnospiraceae bacterium]|nr:hypothetical protein [Lachnospiraceae bacterium]
MQVGGIGAYSYQPYIYNTNTLSARSMDRVEAIDSDLISAKTDFSSLSEEVLNTNPLKKGETSDFAGIFASQMQMSRMNMARIFG